MRHQDASDGCLKLLAGALSNGICQGKPGLVILPMDYERGRILLLPINEQNNELTITIIGPMVWAGTIEVGQAGHMQIECFHDAETRVGQLSVDPRLNLFAGLIESQKRDQSTHFILPDAPSIGERRRRPQR
ncbi:MAG: hypothetical protein DCC59_06305 [Chloroflexi bacterium]|nr:MAG: hypothetical protein DCC59_06305 [Chloroflexota bacterium]